MSLNTKVSPTALRLLHASHFVRLTTRQTMDMSAERVAASLHELQEMVAGRSVTITPEIGDRIADLLAQLAVQVMTDDVLEAVR